MKLDPINPAPPVINKHVISSTLTSARASSAIVFSSSTAVSSTTASSTGIVFLYSFNMSFTESLIFLMSGYKVSKRVVSKKLLDLSAAKIARCSACEKVFHLKSGSTISLYMSNISL